VSATKRTLHRARAAIEGKVAQRDPSSFAGAPTDDDVLARYVRALTEHDIDAMIALMHDEIRTTMPPSPTWLEGLDDNAVFYRRMFAGWADQDIRAVPIGVNGGLGLEFHRGGVVGAIEAIEVRDGKLLRVHHFMQPAVIALFARSA
jgi:RNA polymerase sigma-70 factor (ECF subfamily)